MSIDVHHENHHRILDWRPNHQDESRNYPIRETIRSTPRLRVKDWAAPFVALDQGPDGACVGFGWLQEGMCSPVPVKVEQTAKAQELNVTRPYDFAMALYRLAQTEDVWPGEDYDGTSVNGGARAMRAFGLLREYRWCFGIHDVRDAILSKGPVVIGVNWYSGMFNAPAGILSVDGYWVGGHCVLVRGYRPAGSVPGIAEPMYRIRNSWGPGWGLDGDAFITESDLNALLNEDGEAALATRRSYGRPTKR